VHKEKKRKKNTHTGIFWRACAQEKIAHTDTSKCGETRGKVVANVLLMCC